MKKIIFLLTIILLIGIKTKNVYAYETFYEDNLIDGIYMKEVIPSTNESRYQQARFFRNQNTNEEAYCIEPFNVFNKDNRLIEKNILDNKTFTRLSDIMSFGYGYKNHTEDKWYAATQMLLWKEAFKNDEFYFTDKLNGNKIDILQDEMNEILELANHYRTEPKLKDEEYHTVLKDKIVLTDYNNEISNYITDDPNITIDKNKIIINNPKEGTNVYKFKRIHPYPNKVAKYWYITKGQDMITKGKTGDYMYYLSLFTTKNKIIVNKKDKDTKNIKSKGDASLDGAIIGLYDLDNNLINKKVINNNIVEFNNIEYGKYYIKEIEPGEGYKVNNEKKFIEINRTTKEINIDILNEVIKKEITIHKEYGENINTKNEKEIEFNIINKNNEIIEKVKTDENGNIKITLPYGKYLVKQINTSEGYNKVDDFYIEINDKDNNYTYNLYDYKIPIPDSNISIETKDYIILLMILCLTLILINRYVI